MKPNKPIIILILGIVLMLVAGVSMACTATAGVTKQVEPADKVAEAATQSGEAVARTTEGATKPAEPAASTPSSLTATMEVEPKIVHVGDNLVITGSGFTPGQAVEAIAFQTRDVIDAMKVDTNLQISVLRVDGGGSANNILMQLQADILGIPIQRAQIAETTALGAAYLAGLAAGLWRDTSDIEKHWRSSANYEPLMSTEQRETLYANWKRATERARGWIVD